MSMEIQGGNSDAAEPWGPAPLDSLVEGTAAAVRGLGRRGAVIAVSGGIDSSVVAGICARALGPERILCLRLPEKDVGD